MSQYIQLAVRALSIGTLIVIVAVVFRQAYLRIATTAGISSPAEEPTATLLKRCEAMHSRLKNRHVSEEAAEADGDSRAVCIEL
ncbi:hypothetical protein [Cupriavidus sp. IDO]|uniref:hypothetical protein n=1 Tax=Cupriavidus sp. IDO TaxID=1539142 RepID=UPI0009E4475D|nr:hypothetical protein [Cupriavidus sp. IDO]